MLAVETLQTKSHGNASLLRLRRFTAAFFAVFLIVAGGAAAYHLADQYQSVVSDAKQSARTSVQTVEAFTSRTISETYRVLEGISDVYRLQIKHGRFDERELHDLLQERMTLMPYAATVFVINADRIVVAAPRQFPTYKEKFDDFVNGAGPPERVTRDMLIGGVYQSNRRNPDSPYYLPVAVEVALDGKTLGYAVAILKTDFFSEFFKTIQVGRSGHVLLWQGDGTLVASSGSTDRRIGVKYPEVSKRIEAQALSSTGAEELTYAVNAGYSQDVQAAAPVMGVPMAVVVSLKADDYLAAWRESRNRIGVGLLVLALVMASTGYFIFTQFRRSELNEAALRSAKAAAEEANEAKSRFLAHMSHEFRTPLNAILGFSEIIKHKVLGEGVSPVYTSYADHIHSSGQHLLNIVNDILDVARIESGIQALQIESVSIADAIEAAVKFVLPQAHARDIELNLQVNAGLPRLMADDRYLRQVLINLLTNAVKFSPAGSEVTVTAHTDADHLSVTVTDNGSGIDPGVLARIGEPFLQGNPSVSRLGQGAGLGLSICKQYMDLLGGSLKIESSCDGTKAALHFPASTYVANQNIPPQAA